MDSINDKINTIVIGGKYGFEFIPTEEMAKKIGVSAVGLRFMFGILIGEFLLLHYEKDIPAGLSSDYTDAVRLLTLYYVYEKYIPAATVQITRIFFF